MLLTKEQISEQMRKHFNIVLEWCGSFFVHLYDNFAALLTIN